MLTAPEPMIAQSGQDLFQQALVMERANGELRGAIALYERIIEEFTDDRELAARALVQIGGCYEKLGQDEAQTAYQRVVDDYPDQAEVVAEARERLAALRRSFDDTESSSITVRRVWAGRYGDPVEFSGGPSPDGRYLVYIDWDTGNLAVRDLVNGQSRQLTRDGYQAEAGGFPVAATVSPNGDYVAYPWVTADSTMELRVIGIDGSGQRSLCSHSDIGLYPGSWSPDGQHIAVTFHTAGENTTEVVWVSTEDGSMTRLGTFDFRGGMPLSHSPDGRFVAAHLPVLEDSNHSDISLIATDGSGVVPLVAHPSDDRLMGWLPGTEHLLFLSDRSGSWDLWAVRVQDGEAQGDPRPVKRAIGDVGHMGFTGDGEFFYYQYTLRYTTSIVPFDENTGLIRLQESEPLLGASSNNRPAWSPSGEQLAFVRRVPAPPGRGYRGYRDYQKVLSVRNVTTGEEGALASHLVPATVGTPEWFRDGQSILLIAMLEEDNVTGDWSNVPTALYRVDLASGEATSLMGFRPDPAWWFGISALPTSSGDGVIYVHDGRLAVRDIASGREVELYRHPDLASHILALSPDGENVLFGIADSTVDDQRPKTALREGGRLMMVPSRGGDVRELVRLEVPCTVRDVTWTSDGRYVLYVQRDEGGTAIMRVAPGGIPDRLWETAPRTLGMLSSSPDGRRAAYITQENEAEIWVMENLKEVLQRQH
jgi:Tol biopolymer transport system component